MLGPTKQVIVHTLPQDERRRQLEEGPVPFLFNMRVDQATARYRWRFLKEVPATAESPAAYFVEIEPLQKIDMEEFSKAWIKLDKEALLPEALMLFSPNGKDTRTYSFSGVERNGEKNKAGNPKNYDGATMARDFEKYGYKIIVNDGTAPAAAPAQLGNQSAQPDQAPKGSRRR